MQLCTSLLDKEMEEEKKEDHKQSQSLGSTICKTEGLKILTQVSGCQLTKACAAPSLFDIPEANTEEPSK